MFQVDEASSSRLSEELVSMPQPLGLLKGLPEALSCHTHGLSVSLTSTLEELFNGLLESLLVIECRNLLFQG